MAKIGLVLEGGGMRGSYTLGILDAFLENRLYFPYVIGVSAGACNAASYVSRQYGRGQRISENWISDPRYLSFRNLLGKEHSMFGMNFLFGEIPAHLDPFDFDAFYASGTRTVVGVTDADTGKERYLENPPRGCLNTCFCASSSIPLFSPVVELNGMHLLDGGTADPIPFEEALRHCDKVVVVLTRPRNFIKKPLPMPFLYRQALRRYPAMAKTCENRHLLYNRQREKLLQLEREGRALAFYPDTMDISAFEKNPEKLHALYLQGHAQMCSRLADLQKFLSDAEDMLLK